MTSDTFRETKEWQQYREQLNQFIASADSGMLINADDEWFVRTRQDSEGKAGFKLQNGKVVKKFVTIWELFDHRVEFQACINKLTQKALEIRRRVPFSRIVTATPTARELAEYLFDGLQKQMPDQEFAVSHFGNYPTAMLPQPLALSFNDERVLVVTDVVNSGYLINAMAEVIIKNGGWVAAVLAVIITNREWVEHERMTKEPWHLDFAKGGARLHSLTDFIIDPSGPDEYDESKIIPIDYSCVLPERRNGVSTYYAPAFTIGKTLEHLEAAEAIDFGFYDFDDTRFTSAFVLPRLLDKYKTEIWNHIKVPIIEAAENSRKRSQHLLIVTTYKRKDLLFKDHIHDCLAKEGYETASALTLKRGVTDTPYLNLTLGARGTEVRGREVILALGTLSTHEKLRNIVSLLVDGQVSKIVVVCLLNRMGPFTTNFIRAIERFTNRVTVAASPEAGQTFTRFTFSMVYSFLDLRNPEVGAIGNELDWLFSRFRNQTKNDPFGRLCDRIGGYFQSKTSIARAYQASRYQPLSEPYSLKTASEEELNSLAVSTQEGKIALLTYNLALNRDFQPVLDEVISTLDRATFIQLYGLLLSDIHYLRFTGALTRLKENVLTRLDSVRRERFKIEEDNRSGISDAQAARIKEFVNAEIYLVLGLGIIAHYDSPEHLTELSDSITDLLFCTVAPESWLNTYPVSLQEYFCDERVFFVIAFLLQGLYPEFNRNEIARDLKHKLDERVEQFKRSFKESNLSKAQKRLILNNLDLMLTETGKHDNLEKHQLVRYLHREVLRPREGHNPIFTTMRELINSMNAFLSSSFTNPPQRFEIDSSLLGKVDEALSGTSSLHMIAKTVRQLFFFTPTVQDQQARYTSVVGQQGFATDADELIRRLHEIRQRRAFSLEDRDKLDALDTKLRADFLDKDSHLRMTLRSYVVNLEEVVERALNDSNAQLNKERFQDILLSSYNSLRQEREAGRCRWPVLSDYHLIRETLRNVLSNLRHAFPDEVRSNLPAEVVSIKFTQDYHAPYPEERKKSSVALKMIVAGRAPNREDFIWSENTISDQLLRIQELGGDWDLIAGEGGRSF